MKTFHNNPELKAMLLEEIKWHQDQDKIVQGSYGSGDDKNFKGCAVGCSIKSLNNKCGKAFKTNDHEVYETELGIPKELAYIEDALFEEMPIKDSKLWPLRFMEAIPVGADLSKVVAQFVIWEFEDHEKGLKNIKEIQDDKQLYGWCEEVVALYKRDLAGDKPSEDEFYDLYKRIDGAWAWTRARTRAWARGARAWAWAGAWAGTRAWARGAGTRAWTGAWTWAWTGTRAWARAWTGAEYQKEIMVSANKIIELMRACDPNN